MNIDNENKNNFSPINLEEIDKRVSALANFVHQEIANTNAMLEEIYWSQIYNNTISESKWLLNKTISPGRSAIGYNFLYVLYRVLDEMRPKSILELGLGQSTKLTSQFAGYNKTQHVVVEHDQTWADFFKNSWNKLSNFTSIVVTDLLTKELNGNKYYAYKDFDKLISSRGLNYSLILIDGPFGGGGVLSRRDTLPLIPQILEKDFVIMIDDCGRPGEIKLVHDLKNKLSEHFIDYAEGFYKGVNKKDLFVIVSKNLKFLTSL